jgi:hypothetical protein
MAEAAPAHTTPLQCHNFTNKQQAAEPKYSQQQQTCTVLMRERRSPCPTTLFRSGRSRADTHHAPASNKQQQAANRQLQ